MNGRLGFGCHVKIEGTSMCMYVCEREEGSLDITEAGHAIFFFSRCNARAFLLVIIKHGLTPWVHRHNTLFSHVIIRFHDLYGQNSSINEGSN